MHTFLRRSFPIAAAACALFAACSGGTVPSQVFTKPAPVSVAPPAARTSAGPWAYRPSTQRQAFTVDQTAVIAIRPDTAARTDSISTHVEVAFTRAPSGGTNGNVTAYTVQGAARAAVSPAGLTLPFPFRAEYSASGQQLDFTAPRDATPCSSIALAAAQSLRDLWFKAPDSLRVGSAWSDSSSYVVCRDAIPLRATARRSFRVSGSSEHDGHAVLTISRTSRTTLDGTGTQFGETVGVSGAGGGSLDYELDMTSGEILSAKGTSTLDLTLRSRVRTQVVRQTVEIRIGRS
jgi:hypothetical protein